jgi:general nucleoside transport system ATP-binding protein
VGNDRRTYWALTSSDLSDRIGGQVPLSLQNITKRFGAFSALENVSLEIEPRKIMALLGENGAGKTTLMRIAFGMIQPDTGSILIDGRRAHFTSPADAIAAGIGMVHQQFSLIPAMTVAENVALGGKGKFSLDETSTRLRSIAQRTGLELDPGARVGDLGSAERQKLEIIRTLAHDARVMILDEPTAVLTPKDVGELFGQLRSFAAAGGAVVLITHKLGDAVEHADEVTVLRRGRVVLSAHMTETDESSLVSAMLGETSKLTSTKTAKPETSSIVASLDQASVPERRTGKSIRFSLEVSSGEIVGVAALDGAATLLLRVLARRVKPLSGRVTLPDQIGFVPESRREEALIDDFSLAENLALEGAGERTGVIDWSSVEMDAKTVVAEFDVRTPGIDTSPGKLSGGNQQRFVLGRELRNNPLLLVLENPTQGLDVNASVFVHERMRRARSEGAGVVFYSSDLDELAMLADRVVVVSARGLVHVAADRNAIGRALLGTDAAR